MGSKLDHEVIGERYDTVAGLRFRLVDIPAATLAPLQCAGDAQSARLEVDLVPSQSEQLAAPESEPDRQFGNRD